MGIRPAELRVDRAEPFDVRLAGWARVDGVELMDQRLRAIAEQIVDCVHLNELKRVAWLGLNVHPNHLEARPVVAHRCPTSSTEQV